MTKEEKELRENLKGYEYSERIAHVLNDFFSQNVVITRGKNRHPYADLIHAYAEGAKIQKLTKINPEWIDESYPNFSGTFDWRIKPKEPVYEWQWYRKQEDGKGLLSEFATDKEIKNANELAGYRYWDFKIEETKRERKQ